MASTVTTSKDRVIIINKSADVRMITLTAIGSYNSVTSLVNVTNFTVHGTDHQVRKLFNETDETVGRSTGNAFLFKGGLMLSHSFAGWSTPCIYHMNLITWCHHQRYRLWYSRVR